MSKFGAVNWSEPAVPEVRNVGAAPPHFIRIDVKQADLAIRDSGRHGSGN